MSKNLFCLGYQNNKHNLMVVYVNESHLKSEFDSSLDISFILDSLRDCLFFFQVKVIYFKSLHIKTFLQSDTSTALSMAEYWTHCTAMMTLVGPQLLFAM